MKFAISAATISLPNSNHLPPNFPNNYRSVPANRNRFKIPQIQNPSKKPPKSTSLVVFAAEGGGDGGGGERKRKATGLNLRWRDLLDPDPGNIVAVGLAGLLTWASVQVLWQLLFISVAILLAALKYSFIAALLLVILITLL